MKNTNESMKEGMTGITDEAREYMEENFFDIAASALKKDLSIKTLAGVTDAKEEAIYGQAYLMYNTGKYKEASEIFRILITINSMEPKYLMGLAACMHMQKEYMAAASLYTMCGFIDPKSPVAPFHASDCYIELEDTLSAITALELAITLAGDREEYKALKEKSEVTLAGLKVKAAEEKTAEEEKEGSKPKK